MFLRLPASWKLIKKQNREKSLEDYEGLFYIWIFKQYTWRLLDLPEKNQALFIYFSIFVLSYLSMFVICLLLIYSQNKITPSID